MISSKPISTFYEPLSADDIRTIETQLMEDRNLYTRVYKYIAMVMSLILLLSYYWVITTPISEHFTLEEYNNTVKYGGIVIALVALLITLMFWLHYRLMTSAMRYDLLHGYKVIEYAIIQYKKSLPNGNVYYLGIQSNFKSSIEVDVTTYMKYKMYDEITIEYTPKAKCFLAYY